MRRTKKKQRPVQAADQYPLLKHREGLTMLICRSSMCPHLLMLLTMKMRKTSVLEDDT